MRILLHICCGPCTIGPWRVLTEDAHEVKAYFYNPNIHPLIEFRRRLKAVKVLQDRLPVEVEFEEDYGLRSFLEEVDWEGGNRCRGCYRMRLIKTARMAAGEGFDAFTTTLLASEHQKHNMVREIGEACADQEDIAFLYRDWRHLAEPNHDDGKSMNLYLQQYCGCIFSEYDRYINTKKHIYRGSGGQSSG